jgi:hypothetical protein
MPTVYKQRHVSPEERLRRAATTFWFAIRRFVRRRSIAGWQLPPPNEPPGDEPLPSGVPRRPAPTSGSAAVSLAEPHEPEGP